MIGSRGLPSVRWSATRTAEVVAGVAPLADELIRRGGHVPLLRLPFSGEPLDIPDGYDTAVVLPLADEALARALLAAVEETLPLVLRGLESLVIEVDGTRREITCAWDDDGPVLNGRRWAWISRMGEVTADERQALGAEARDTWSVDAFAPVSGALDAEQVLHAPTPTDEAVSLPVLLSVTAPLEPTRRHLVPGALTTRLLSVAGSAVAALAALVDDPRPLVPVGLGSGPIDVAVRTAALADLPGTAVLQGRLGAQCAVVEPGLEPVVPLLGLEEVLPWPPSPALDALGVRVLDTAAVVEMLAGHPRTPAEWRQVYEALRDAPDRDALGALPVPLVDGRVVTGIRGALVPSGSLPAEVRGLPLRLVDPDAVHPLLERLGAVPATAPGLLDDPSLQAWVADQDGYDDDLARAICALCRAAGDPGWVATTLLLPTADGVEVAGDLLLPGGLLDRSGADLPRLAAPEWLDTETACAAGVLDLPAVVEEQDLSVETPPDVDDAVAWLATVGPQQSAVLVRDLDLASDLPVLLDGMLGDRALRAALLAPSSYAAWWLGAHGALELPASEYALLGDLDGLYAPAPRLPADVLRALGVWESSDQVVADAAGSADLLDRLGSTDALVCGERARSLYVALARRWAGSADAPDPPLTVRTSFGAVAAAADAVVVDAPDLLPLLAGSAPLVVPAADAEAVADLLDLDLLSERHGPPVGDGADTAVPQAFSAWVQVTSYRRCTALVQDGIEIPWRWYDGVLWATDAGLADGLAWASGRWADRHLLRAVAAGGDVDRATLEAALDPA
jgi:hypothetical protein